jgi:hypothetical protein
VAIKEILYNMEQLSSPSSEKRAPHGSHLYWLGKLAEVYVPCCVLGMVGHVSFTTAQTQNRQAHMYTKWFPREEFYEKMGSGYTPSSTPAPWEKRLMTWVGEGTSTVQPFPSIDYIMRNKPDQDVVAFERSLIKKQYTPIGNMARVYSQRRAAQPNTFYNLDIHAFTHKFSDIRGPRSPVVFSFVQKDNPRVWGVKFEDVLRGEYGLFPHVAYTKATLDDFDLRVKAAHPKVKLRAAKKSNFARMGIQSRLRGGRQIIANVADDKLYTDYIVRGVNQMPKSDTKLLFDWLKQNFEHYTVYEEGWDDFSESRRIRVFKPNREQTL